VHESIIGYANTLIGWPLHDIATTNMVCGMAEQGGGGITIDCAILTATYSGGGVQERGCGMPRIVSTSAQCTISETPNEYLVKAKYHIGDGNIV